MSIIHSAGTVYEGRYDNPNSDGQWLKWALRHGHIEHGVDREAWDENLWRVHNLIALGYGDTPRFKIPAAVLDQAERMRP